MDLGMRAKKTVQVNTYLVIRESTMVTGLMMKWKVLELCSTEKEIIMKVIGK